MRVSPRRLRRFQVPFGLHPIRPRQAQPKLMGWRMATHENRARLPPIAVRAFIPMHRLIAPLAFIGELRLPLAAFDNRGVLIDRGDALLGTALPAALHRSEERRV